MPTIVLVWQHRFGRRGVFNSGRYPVRPNARAGPLVGAENMWRRKCGRAVQHTVVEQWARRDATIVSFSTLALCTTQVIFPFLGRKMRLCLCTGTTTARSNQIVTEAAEPR